MKPRKVQVESDSVDDGFVGYFHGWLPDMYAVVEVASGNEGEGQLRRVSWHRVRFMDTLC